MRFVRVGLNRTTGRVQGVVQQDTPFEAGGTIVHVGAEERDGAETLVPHDIEMVDLGVVAKEHDWRDDRGRPTHAARHIHVALEHAKITPEHFDRGLVKAEHCGVSAIHACACTLEGIKAQLRAGGSASIPASIRAWLVLTLPPHHVDGWGLGRGLPISALKAAEVLRNKRDPNSGSRLELLERVAQQRSDDDARTRHLDRIARRAAALAAEGRHDEAHGLALAAAHVHAPHDIRFLRLFEAVAEAAAAASQRDLDQEAA